MKRVLVACEHTGIVRSAFRELGHDAWSCDVLPTEDGSNHHLQCDVLEILTQNWDMMVAFPPCTHLAISGAKHWAEKRADGRQQAAIEFFLALARAPIKQIAIENPINIICTKWRKPNQIVHPYQFGHRERKTTCLWLKDLPGLVPTKVVHGWSTRLHNNVAPGPDRWKERSRTFPGIAQAMATQWGPHKTARSAI